MRIFLISPVRQVTPEEREQIREYVTGLEKEGHSVHWPERDTPQDDPVGNIICDFNRQKILDANEIHLFYNPNSTGSLFDLGIAWSAHKKLVLANQVEPTDGRKSFNNLLL